MLFFVVGRVYIIQGVRVLKGTAEKSSISGLLGLHSVTEEKGHCQPRYVRNNDVSNSVLLTWM